MSGFVGIVNFDGAPADPRLLRNLTQFLAFRGPDAQKIWCEGSVGLGHALLRTANDTAPETQPAQLDGRFWIVADARVDARAELIRKLQYKSPVASALSLRTPDVQLILHAYQAWGEACVEHLLGDFSFAIWDARERRLFCARDHFGFRLFFYATVGNCLVFSNTLDCLRLYPGVSGKLNDLAIADFLLFENNLDLGTSAFADILRVPPAHTLRYEQGRIAQSRFWKLPDAAAMSYRRPEECIDAFREVFDSAVSDRLRGNSAGLHMSGGLDSPTVAISARRVADRRDGAMELKAFTHYHEELIPHEEKHYAGLVAESLRLPIRFLNGDNCRLYDFYEDPEFRTSEPMHPAMGSRNADPAKEMAAFTRIGLAGYGGDPALATLLSAHFARLWRRRKFGQIISDVAGYLAAEGRFSRLYLRTRFRHWFGRKQIEEFPRWVNPDLVKALNLKDRWKAASNDSPANQSARPEAYALVADPYWTSVVESEDASISGYSLEVGYPFFDIRVLEFLLGLPALPWCSDKEILRRAARGILPEQVRLRRKSPLIRDPIAALLRRPESEWVDSFEPVAQLQEYVLRDQVPAVFQTRNPFHALFHLRPLSLNFWLQRRLNFGYKWHSDTQGDMRGPEEKNFNKTSVF